MVVMCIQSIVLLIRNKHEKLLLTVHNLYKYDVIVVVVVILLYYYIIICNNIIIISIM